MGMNPVMMNNQMMMGGGGISYQNPNHNAPHGMGFHSQIDANPGPSQESWYKDGLDMGKKIGLKPKGENDNIAEFKDLFSMASTKFEKKPDYQEAKKKMDISYNPAPYQQPQPAPVQNHQ